MFRNAGKVAPVLRLILAVVAVIASWTWLRAEFRRGMAEGQQLRPGALLLRGLATSAALVWLLVQIFSVLGLLFGLGLVVVVAAIAMRLFVGGGGDSGGGESSPPPPPADAA